MVKYLLLACALALASSDTRADDKADRERRVKVALSLAAADVKAPAVVAVPAAARVAVDWFGDAKAAKAPCPCCAAAKQPHPATTVVGCACQPGHTCGSDACPGDCVRCGEVKKAPTPSAAPAKVEYRTEKQCFQWYDARGYLHSECRDVVVPVTPGK